MIRDKNYIKILSDLRADKDKMIKARDEAIASYTEPFIIDGINRSIKDISQAIELLMLESGKVEGETIPIYGAPFYKYIEVEK